MCLASPHVDPKDEDEEVTFILWFTPAWLYGQRPHRRIEQLRRWLRQLLLPNSNRDVSAFVKKGTLNSLYKQATVLRARLLEGVTLLYKCGATLLFQSECRPGQTPTDLPLPTPISELVLETAAEQIVFSSRFAQNEKMMKEAF